MFLSDDYHRGIQSRFISREGMCRPLTSGCVFHIPTYSFNRNILRSGRWLVRIYLHIHHRSSPSPRQFQSYLHEAETFVSSSNFHVAKENTPLASALRGACACESPKLYISLSHVPARRVWVRFRVRVRPLPVPCLCRWQRLPPSFRLCSAVTDDDRVDYMTRKRCPTQNNHVHVP